MALQGTLDTFALPDVLRLLDSTQKTGCLRLSGSRGSGHVWVDEGSVVGAEASELREGSDAVDVLFELLRFDDGSFTFEQDAEPTERGAPQLVDVLLGDAEARVKEWEEIAKVVPSLECWVRLTPELPGEELVVSSARWRVIVAVASGTTVRRIGEELELAEVPVSRVVKDLVEAGLVEVEDNPTAAGADPVSEEPLVVQLPEAAVAPPHEDVEVFEPMTFESDQAPETMNGDEAKIPADDALLKEMFPGLAGHDAGGAASPAMDDVGVDDALTGPSIAEQVDDPDLAQQLGNLSPKAAAAVQAAATAATDEEREAALESAGDDDTINRGLLLKFLGSVHS